MSGALSHCTVYRVLLTTEFLYNVHSRNYCAMLRSSVLCSEFRLLARRKNFRRGFARIRADWFRADRFRADPPDVRQKYFSADSAERPANVRRTPADSARIRADPRGLRGELAEEFTRKMSADKNLPNTTVPRGETSAADVLPPRK